LDVEGKGERGEGGVVRRCIVKVGLSEAQKRILCSLATRLGASESEMMRVALMAYAKDMNLVQETVQGEKRLVVECVLGKI